ncbi:hypothetical protein [Flexivirga sp.]|uniref:hypothetical protein n=1 Tax=Flexivirga sp. TaxID=1962927 RepID=UPI003F7FA23D
MSRRAKPGETYWALVSTNGHEADSPWVTVLGSHWGVTVDPGPHHEYGRVYTSRERAAEWQANLPHGTAGKPLEIAQVDYLGGSYFKRHVDDLESTVDERVTPTTTDPRRDSPTGVGDRHAVRNNPSR